MGHEIPAKLPSSTQKAAAESDFKEKTYKLQDGNVVTEALPEVVEVAESFGEDFGLAAVRQDLKYFEEFEEREGLSSQLLSAKAVLVAKLARLSS